MNPNTSDHRITRTALMLLIGAFALIFAAGGIVRAGPLMQQSGTATPVPEEADTTTTPAAEEETPMPEETPSPIQETPSAEETESPEDEMPPAEETVPAEEETAELELTATPAEDTGEEATSEVTPTTTPEPLSDEELIEMGGETFTKYCAACHQADGQGITNAFPALAGNAFVLTEDPSPVLRVIFTGRAGMPHFRGAFSDREIAAVVSYIRNAWDNDASVVSAEQVRTIEEEVYSPSEPMEHSGESD